MIYYEHKNIYKYVDNKRRWETFSFFQPGKQWLKIRPQERWQSLWETAAGSVGTSHLTVRVHTQFCWPMSLEKCFPPIIMLWIYWNCIEIMTARSYFYCLHSYLYSTLHILQIGQQAYIIYIYIFIYLSTLKTFRNTFLAPLDLEVSQMTCICIDGLIHCSRWPMFDWFIDGMAWVMRTMVPRLQGWSWWSFSIFTCWG